jgi:hypothetical protein
VRYDRYRKRAAALFDARADGAIRFDFEDVVADIKADLQEEVVNDELISEFARSLAHSIDDARASRADSQQLNLLTGETAAMDAVWRLGDGVRVRARHATRSDVLLWFGIRSANTDRVIAAFERDRTAVAELLVYMPDESVTVEMAAAARIAALSSENPEP